MRRLDGIIESTLPPNKNTLWLDKGIVKYYRNGKWVTIIAKNEDIDINWDNINNKPKFANIAISGNYEDLNNKPTLSKVATSGNYEDLSNKPTIPTKYILPAATLENLGGIKKGSAISDITEATIPAVVNTINSLLAVLRTCGILTS